MQTQPQPPNTDSHSSRPGTENGGMLGVLKYAIPGWLLIIVNCSDDQNRGIIV